ncbi:DUF4224 domain-containing protein [Comamonas koreensis]|uniref:DUF4224 domain-containing protein n=1 Tax=Comamonas koreensis TaxID=160825 RepID=A0AAW4XRK9_9BURK|nr:DUF4224 domain-containing protein [Comamonas koreensis]MCD2163831.1 DUF4224 domain-containing protein [Comamonas koreensis]
MSETEFLNAEELLEVTGYKTASMQRDWLNRNGWQYAVNGAGRPVVGRWFARLRLAGVQPTAHGLQQSGKPNFAALG